MSTNNPNQKFSDTNYEDLDLKILFNFLKRHRLKIFITSFGISFLTILFSFTQKIVWQGDFQIVIEKKDGANNMQDQFLSNLIPLSSRSLKRNNETEENILKSPYLLKPVYEKFSKEIKKKDYKFISYKKWVNDHLKINFLEESKVLGVKLNHHDKELIITTLLDISDRYQDYSKEDKIKSLKRSSDFLESQLLILKERSKNSLKKFNAFSIKNGLGDIDGFVELKPEKFNLSNSSKNNKPNKSELLLSKTGSGQRFKAQFRLLEGYEATYSNLLAKLKPESKVLIDLKKSITSLKESLKRPNEIILEFRNLKRKAERDLYLLAQVESQLNITSFEQAKEEEPWQVISNPKIAKGKIYPKRSQIGIISFLIAFIASTSIIYLREKKSGQLFEIDEIKNNLLFDYIADLKYQNYELNELIINNLINKTDKELKTSEIGIVLSSKQFNNNKPLNPINFFNNKFKEINLNLINIKDLDKFKKIIIFIEKGNINFNEINILNNYLDLYREKVIGFFTLTSK